jgi:PAS domain S-box-containing protein
MAGLEGGCRLSDREAPASSDQIESAGSRLGNDRDKYAELFDFAPEGYFVLDRSGKVVEASLAGLNLLLLERSVLLQRGFDDLVHPDDSESFSAFLTEVFSDRESVSCEVRLRPAPDTIMATAIHGTSRGFVGAMPTCRIQVQDISKHPEHDRRQQLLVRLLGAISVALTKEELIGSITRTIADWLQCDAIGIRLKRGEDYPYYESRGFSREFLLVEDTLCARDEQGKPTLDASGKAVLECMCSNILSGRFDPSKPYFSEGGSFWSNSTTELLASTSEQDHLARTRNRCNAAGYESIALIPIRCENETLGLLQINHQAKGLFSPDLIRFLETVASYLALALAHRFAIDQLKESKTEYRRIVETAQEGIWVLDANRVTTFVNPQMATMLGFRPEEMIGLRLEGFVFEEDRPAYEQRMKERSTGKADRYFQRWRHSDGHGVWCQVSPTAVFDSTGSFAGSFAMFTDVTQQVFAEKALRESEARFVALFEDAPLGYQSLDENGRFIEVNRMWLETLGYDKEDVMGKWFGDFLAPEFIEAFRERFPLFKAGGSIHSEFEMLHKNGHRHCIAFEGRIGYQPDGSFKQTHCIMKDITAHRRAVEALCESERRFRTVADHTYDWEFWQGLNGTILYMSPSVLRITGYDREEFISDPGLLERIVHPDDLKKYLRHPRNVENQDNIPALEFRIVCRDGGIRWIGHVCAHVFDERNEYHGVRVSNRDITVRKQAEASLLAEQTMLRDKNVALREVLEHIETEKNLIKDQITANKDRVILPLLASLKGKVGNGNRGFVDLVEKALEEITSPFANNLSKRCGSLSPREVEVCAMIKNGMLSKEIADCLGVSVQTVHKFRQRIRQKLGITNDSTDLGEVLRSM